MDTKSLAQPAHDSRTRERLSREERGIQLFEERGHGIQQLARGLYSVPSCTGRRDYLVRYDAQGESCECKDFEFGHVCKHLYSVALFAAKRRKAVRVLAEVLEAWDEDYDYYAGGDYDRDAQEARSEEEHALAEYLAERGDGR